MDKASFHIFISTRSLTIYEPIESGRTPNVRDAFQLLDSLVLLTPANQDATKTTKFYKLYPIYKKLIPLPILFLVTLDVSSNIKIYFYLSDG